MPAHLILGGARSGKTGYAETQALAGDDPLHYVATATAQDSEMAARIERHRQARSSRFTTHECGLELAAQLQSLDQPGATLLVDCLTLWITNHLLAEDEAAWLREREALLAVLPDLRSNCLLVSNEVGQGVIPMGELNRRFVDAAGWLHQDIAGLADRVTWVVAGLPQKLK